MAADAGRGSRSAGRARAHPRERILPTDGGVASSHFSAAVRHGPDRRNEMKIKLTSVYVDDQDKALRFYTDVLGFTKKADFSNGPFRWLTVASPEDADGTELQLALNNNPATKAYQQALFQQGQPATMFFTDDIKGDCERI